LPNSYRTEANDDNPNASAHCRRFGDDDDYTVSFRFIYLSRQQAAVRVDHILDDAGTLTEFANHEGYFTTPPLPEFLFRFQVRGGKVFNFDETGVQTPEPSSAPQPVAKRRLPRHCART
jgi:hypothetical protein